jgi:effector-binding domain-containing protein
MLDTPRILKTTAQPLACIRFNVPAAEVRNIMGPGLGELRETLRTQGVTPVGPWLNHHLKMPSRVFEFELAVPVAAPITPAGRVVNSELPATTVARTIYRGPYEGLAAAWGEFQAWIVAQGRTPAPWLWETYATGPADSSDPSQWQTELTRPLLE